MLIQKQHLVLPTLSTGTAAKIIYVHIHTANHIQIPAFLSAPMLTDPSCHLQWRWYPLDTARLQWDAPRTDCLSKVINVWKKNNYTLHNSTTASDQCCQPWYIHYTGRWRRQWSPILSKNRMLFIEDPNWTSMTSFEYIAATHVRKHHEVGLSLHEALPGQQGLAGDSRGFE